MPRLSSTTRPRPSPTASTQRIVDAIALAVAERRLLPGTKLVEQQIADLFRVSRTLVRPALSQLARHGLVTLKPARGAFVAQPSVEEARQLFQARRLIEVSLVKQLASGITPVQVGELQTHLKAEREAVRLVDTAMRTHLLSDFHVLLARQLGNDVLAQMLGDLLMRSSLVALMYQSTHSAQASHGEHAQIVEALGRHDGRGASKLMEAHLEHVEHDLKLDVQGHDLAAALGFDTQSPL